MMGMMSRHQEGRPPLLSANSLTRLMIVVGAEEGNAPLNNLTLTEPIHTPNLPIQRTPTGRHPPVL